MQHSLSADNGYTLSLELESKLPEDTAVDLAEENKRDVTGVIAYYRDEKTGKEKTVTAGDQSKPKRLRWLYATEKTTKRQNERLIESGESCRKKKHKPGGLSNREHFAKP